MPQDRTDDHGQGKGVLKEKFDDDLADLDQKISRLRVLYDQYFMGIERVEPLMQRGEIAKFFLRSNIPQRGNTAHKFRYRSLQQKFTSFCGYWDRIVRLIEDGKIRRGVIRPGDLRFTGDM